MKLATAEIMKELDRKTIQIHGVPGETLMERAGEGVVRAVVERFPEPRGKRVVVMCGKGNNGGDGYVVARLLLREGAAVTTLLLGSRDDVKGDAALNLDRLMGTNVPIHEVSVAGDLRGHRALFDGADIIVDAIFGTGLSSEVTGLYREAIEAVNTSGKPVVSVDIPSGLNSDTGRPLGCAVRADLTVTMGLPKVGLVVHPGCEYAGDLRVVDIGIPASLVDAAGVPYTYLDEGEFFGFFPKRKGDSHKGTYGHVLILAGSLGKTGAAALAARAAVRTGAGLVTIGVPRGIYPIVAAKLDEAMPEPLPETRSGALGLRAWGRIAELMEGKDALAVGPGVSMHPETKKLILRLAEKAALPMVIDADGVNDLAGSPAVLSRAAGPRILTPHPGEMSRITGLPTGRIQEDRIGAARDFARRYGAILVLKGARTVIADPRGEVAVNSTGNPGMASGGMGDVLTGIIGSLLAQGIPPVDAARAGVFLHGWAGDRVADERGEAGMAASDLLERIPPAIRRFTRGRIPGPIDRPRAI